MNIWKQSLLGSYYYSTLPWRHYRQKQRQEQGTDYVRILFYHRIADENPNGWTMSCRAFQQQIEWLAKHYQIVSLKEAQERLRSDRVNRPTACITFDDGYADNCDFALPLLLRNKLPFTYFVSTDFVKNELPFPHDTEAGVPLRPNSAAEILSLANAGVEIGAHTRTHADLGKVASTEALTEEIVGSKEDLEAITGQEVSYFAFPFGLPGNLSQEAFSIAHQAGFSGACSAYGGYNQAGDDVFHLQRFHADPELIRLKNWMTIDPRKRNLPRYDTGDYQEEGLTTLVDASANVVAKAIAVQMGKSDLHKPVEVPH